MPIINRIRLPLYLKGAQFPAEATRFRLANGESKTLSVVVRKTYNLVTDYMTDSLHQRLVIALNHDDVSIEGDRYVGGVTVDGDYEITRPDFLDYPQGQASVQIQVTPFDATNDNCRTCEEAGQLSLEDDTFPNPFDEDETDSMNVYANDSICCFPVTASITYFNTSFVQSASIDAETGVLTLTIKSSTQSGTDLLLATYRVTCPNGDFDEANVYGTVVGTEPTCEMPTGLVFDDETDTVSWTGSGNFEWQLYECDDLGTPIDSGTTATNSVTFDDLSSGQCYTFTVRKDCGAGSFSEWNDVSFSPEAPENGCGKFRVTNLSFPFDPFQNFSYMNCAGVIVDTVITTFKDLCLLVDENNNPIYYASDESLELSIEYLEPC